MVRSEIVCRVSCHCNYLDRDLLQHKYRPVPTTVVPTTRSVYVVLKRPLLGTVPGTITRTTVFVYDTVPGTCTRYLSTVLVQVLALGTSP